MKHEIVVGHPGLLVGPRGWLVGWLVVVVCLLDVVLVVWSSWFVLVG